MSEQVGMGLEDFVEFGKIFRLYREIVVTEKIDGTNAQVVVSDDGTQVRAASRTRWIAVGDDNAGFAGWVEKNRDELLKLGPGRHYGEWWGAGVGRKYGLPEKRFSLFNVSRWGDVARVECPKCSLLTEGLASCPRCKADIEKPASTRPTCCGVVPVLYRGPFSQKAIDDSLDRLREMGSVAAPGFMKPEGIVVFHPQSNYLFKITLDGDGHKGAK